MRRRDACSPQQRPDDGDVDLLIAEMVAGRRELIAGALRDPQFGPTVMLGVGGVFAEAIDDVVFRPAPLDDVGAAEMIGDLRTQTLLGSFRGEAASRPGGPGRSPRRPRPADHGTDRRGQRRRQSADHHERWPTGRRRCARRVAVGAGGRRPPSGADHADRRAVRRAVRASRCGRRRSLDAPRQVRVRVAAQSVGVGVPRAPSTAPASTATPCSACRPSSTSPNFPMEPWTWCSCAHRPPPTASCSRHAPRRGSRRHSSRRPATAKPGRMADEPRPHLVAARRRARHPPRRSQRTGRRQHPGVAVRPDRRPVPDRPAASPSPVRAATSCPASSTWRGRPASGSRVPCRRATPPPCPSPTICPTTPRIRRPLSPWPTSKGSPTVGRCSTSSPRRLDASRSCSSRAVPPLAERRRRPATPGRWRLTTRCSTASAGRPGSPGRRRSRRRSRRRRRSPPSRCPRGPRVVVVTTAGGWGVVTADAITRHDDLELVDLPDDLRATIDALLPPRWSRSNPIDCAGGETRDTIPEVLRAVAEHDGADAVILLGIGIQSNQARLMREGRSSPTTASTASSTTTNARTPATPPLPPS